MISRFIVALALLSGSANAPGAEQAKLSLKSNGKTVMTYNAAYVTSPVKDAPYYGRSGFIHPVLTPAGKVVTDAFPKDHPHQHGLMFAWTTGTFEGRKINFWDQKRQQGIIEHARTVHADKNRIQVELRHVETHAGKRKTVLNETWELIRIPHKELNVFDLVSTQTCASKKPVTMRKYHYGAMMIRGAENWMTEGGRMITDEGKQRKDGNHSRPRWVSVSGNVDGEPCGITAMSHPSNFRSPQPVRLHPTKPYFCFAPMVLGEFSIEPGKPYVSRYRIIAFDGEPDRRKLEAQWQQFTRK